MSGNAVWLTASKGEFEVGLSARVAPKNHQIIVRSHALAINPVDALVKYLGILVDDYPALLGFDIAGKVVEVGEGVGRFKIGDRVLGFAHGGFSSPEKAGFQEYVAIDAYSASKIPDSLSFAAACALPASAATAAIALFSKDYLGLEKAELPAKSILIWGGASSVGSSAVQLASGLGYRVFAVASAKNHEKIRALGAEEVFDYNEESVVEDLVAALKHTTLAGGFTAVPGEDAVMQTAEVLAQSEGKKFVATAMAVPDIAEGITGKMVYFGFPDFSEEVTRVLKLVFQSLEIDLASGKYAPFPQPKIVGRGFKAIGGAVQEMNKGVSAVKLVVEIP